MVADFGVQAILCQMCADLWVGCGSAGILGTEKLA
jgi:hypothetical protein